MRAAQSSSTAGWNQSGRWGRTEQFAALRYYSRHLETDAAPPSPLSRKPPSPVLEWDFLMAGPLPDDVVWGGGPEPVPGLSDEKSAAQNAAMVRDAGQLLQSIHRCNRQLADETIPFEEWSRRAAELAWLKERSWELMTHFLNTARNAGGANQRQIRLEKGAAGWIAC